MKQQIVTALKQNLLPGLVLQSFALSIVLVYFFVPESQGFFSIFGDLKKNYGCIYSFFATALFGGAIPFLYLYFSRSLPVNTSLLALFLFYTIFWGARGVEVDFFYRLQGILFGYENNLATIATKVSIDQFIYSALWAAPTIAIAYVWMENQFSFSTARQLMNRDLFLKRIPVMVVSNWLVWIPAVSIIYCMPNNLQIPLFNLVLCFWVLILAVLGKK